MGLEGEKEGKARKESMGAVGKIGTRALTLVNKKMGVDGFCWMGRGKRIEKGRIQGGEGKDSDRIPTTWFPQDRVWGRPVLHGWIGKQTGRVDRIPKLVGEPCWRFFLFLFFSLLFSFFFTLFLFFIFIFSFLLFDFSIPLRWNQRGFFVTGGGKM